MGPLQRGDQENLRGWGWRLVLAFALTVALIAALLASGALPSLDQAFGKRGKPTSADSQYRPGWGCGDRNHVHTGPPGRQYATPPPGCLKKP
jgi:hypothetical protein